MRRKILFSIFLLTVTVSALIIACNNEDKKTGPEKQAREDSVKMMVERGHYLANYVTLCVVCHGERDITKFALPLVPGTEGTRGHPFGKEDGVPGVVFPPNITPFALKDWTDDEIARAMVQGINKKGDTLFPIMPYFNYNIMPKEDVYSIIAYLRTLKPIDSTTPPRQLEIPLSMLGPLPQSNIDKNVMPDLSDKVSYGKYLTTIASCGECHTPRGQQGPDMSKAFAGGFTFSTPFMKVTTANITPDSATGIGIWTEEVFVQKFKVNSSDEAVNKNPGKQNTFMPWAEYGKMKEEDLRAIYAYLRTVPPVKNKVEKWPGVK
jgi:hypothetical protein